MKHVLMLAPVPVSSAATRFRLQQYVPALEASGFTATIRPFLKDAELKTLYGRGPVSVMARAAIAAVARRLDDLVTASKADLVVVQREAALIGPPVLEWLIVQCLRCPLVFDFDDAVWESYVSPTYGKWLPRLVKMPGKTRFNIAAARQVMAGNNYLAAYANRFNPRVTVLPTVVDTSHFKPRKVHNHIPVLGWIGSHSTVRYLLAILPALTRLARTHRFLLRVIGANNDQVRAICAAGLQLDLQPWRLEAEVEQFQALDVGLYPMIDDAWSRGKSGFKAVQYMACGVPVVASPVGSVNEMICTDANGFLARSEDEWVQVLTRLLESQSLRERIGEAARQSAQRDWSLHKFAPVFVDVLKRALT